MRTIFALAVGVFVVSTPAFSQPTCDDEAVLAGVVATYFGLSEYRNITDEQIRRQLSAAPEMQHWRRMAQEGEVGEAIANWVINIGVEATISAQHLAKSITTTSSSYDPISKKYTCQATLEFDNKKLISYLSLAALNSWLQTANGFHELDVGASMNDTGKWQAVEHSLAPRLRQIAEKMAFCVRKRVTFTVQPSKSDFTIGLDSNAAYDQDCLERPPALR